MKYLILLLSFLQLMSCAEVNQPNNVLVLFTDDQRWNTIQALGNAEIHTPNMDRLAKMGVSFNRAYVMGSMHGAVCAPSRAMLLAGKPYFNIPRSYIDQGHVPYDSKFDFVTFPEHLREKGYQTFFTGKWHNHTSKIGEGFEDGKNLFIGGMHLPEVGGHKHPQLWDFDKTGKYGGDQKWQGEKFSSEMYADAALEFLDNRRKEDPFCLYVAFTSPHDPREAPEKYLNMYDTSTISLPPNFVSEHPFDNGHLRTRDENLAAFPRTPEIVKNEIAGYYAMVSEVDAEIGRILDRLEDQNLLEETIIVFAGDNGLAVGQHGLLGKQSVYEHSVRVPLIIAAPGINGNRVSQALCYLYDIFPTVTNLLDIETPNSVEGLSLKPVLLQPDKEHRKHLFLSHAQEMRAIRTADDMKLIRYHVSGQTHEQLFDLKADPWEMDDLSENKNYFGRKKSLLKMMIGDMSLMNDDFVAVHIRSDQIDNDQVQISISKSMPIGDIHYTTDRTSPNENSSVYQGPFIVDEATSILAAIFQDGEMVSELDSMVVWIQKNIKEITWDQEPSSKYPGKGKQTLTNGPNGGKKLSEGEWIGYDGADFGAIIELEKIQPISKVGVRYLHQPGSWIFAPKKVDISISTDGISYTNVVSVSYDDSKSIGAGPIFTSFDIEEQEVKFVKYDLKNIGHCPDWHPGKGKNAWLFIDELFLN